MPETNRDNFLKERTTPERNMTSWANHCLPDVPESIFPDIGVKRPDLFPVDGVGILDFTDINTFNNHNIVPYLTAVHRGLIIDEFPALAGGHSDEHGTHYATLSEDPRITIVALQDPRHQMGGTPIAIVKTIDILTLHYPGISLPPSKTGYAMGKKVAAIAEEIALRKDEVRIFEMGVGSGIIMVSTLKNFPGQNIHYIGGEIDERCLAITEKGLQINGFSPEKWRLSKGGLLEPIRHTKVDIIVSNPPYFPTDFARRAKNTGPIDALDGGKDGLNFYRALIKDGPERLFPGGKLLLQVSNVNLQAVRALAERHFGSRAKVKVVRENGREIEQFTNHGKAILIELL